MKTTIVYTLNVTVTRPVRYDNDETIEEMAAWRHGSDAKRELAREVMRALRVIDGDCDVDVLESTEGQE